MSCEEVFMKQLREQGFRFTPQREIILSVMHQIKDYATAETITSQVHKHSTSIDISTVYRTLDLLQDFNMVACVDTGDGQHRYKLVHSHAPHLYLVCKICQEVTPLNLEATQILATYLEEHLGFEADFDHLSIPGACKMCSAEQRQNLATA